MNAESEYLLIQNEEKDKSNVGLYSFPIGEVRNIQGPSWEILAKHLTEAIKIQTGIQVADGMIPFADEAFLGTDGFDRVMHFFICKQAINEDTHLVSDKPVKKVWKKFEDFEKNDFNKSVYLAYAKADQFIKQFSS